MTSANRSGQPDARTAEDVIAQLDGRIALVLDGGPTTGGLSSTIVDCTTPDVKVIRVGAISTEEIRSAIASAKVA